MKKLTLIISMSLFMISTNSFSASLIDQAKNNNQVYNQQQFQNQQQTQNYVLNEDTKIEKEKTEPKTAAEQGYQSEEEQYKIRERIESYSYQNTARQKGIVINVPIEEKGVLSNKNEKMWLFNWKGRLLDKGISSEKIDFEAERLNKSEFEKWASRQIRYTEE